MYLPHATYKFPVKSPKTTLSKLPRGDSADESTYPELYRKSEYIKGSNDDVPKPFQIGKLQLPLKIIYILSQNSM